MADTVVHVHWNLEWGCPLRSADEWNTVMQTMIDRGAELSPEETKVIMDYLNAHYGA